MQGEQKKEQQILVLKGWEGLADRLQSLSHCMNYCIKFNAAICVDWRDYMWGQGKRNFSDYFQIVGIPVVSLETVLKRIEEGAKVNPPAYTLSHLEAPPAEIIHFSEFASKIDNNCLKQEGDIIVHNSKGTRMWHLSNLIQNLRIAEEIRPVIISKLSRLYLPYTSVHLRGTDRKTDSTLKFVSDNYDLLPPHAKARSYIISDMRSLTSEWIALHPESRIVDDAAPVLKIPPGKQGTHMLLEEVLEFYGITKHELNINTITDFLVIAFASWGVGHGESTFTRLATFLRQGGAIGISKWLDWMPSRSRFEIFTLQAP
jgi:hypothetical protein